MDSKTYRIVKTSRRDWLLTQIEKYQKEPQSNFRDRRIEQTLKEIGELNKLLS